MSRPAPQDRGTGTPEFVQRLLGTLPAVLLVVDVEGTIIYTAGSLGSLAQRREVDLVGQRLVQFVDDSERSIVTELLKMTASSPEGEIIGPARVSYFDVDETRRTTVAWGVNQLKDPEIKGLCILLLPESAYDRFDKVLMSVVAGSSLEQTFGALVQALRFPPVSAESFFLMPGVDDRTLLRIPDIQEVPGPPSSGPWDDIWSSKETVVHLEPGRLAAPLRNEAKKAGFASVSCYAVHRGADGRPQACLVIWSRNEGPPAFNAAMVIERANAIADLAISHASAAEGLRDAAYRDPLTGLGNRRSFFEALEAQVASGAQPAVLYIDLDGFKAVNDTLGHLAGDAVLRVAARRLSSIMRPTDELARLGGDEFAVLCGGPVTRDQISTIATRIVEQLSQPLSVGDNQTVDMGASVGIALDLTPGTPPDTILGHADRALYQAKAKGRSRFAFAELL